MKVKHIHLTGYLLLLTAVMTAGCNQADKSQMRSADSVKVIHPDKDLTGSMESLKGCYLAVLQKDTLQLAITTVEGESVKGSLTLNFAEKDRSHGQFEGKYNQGILVANYKFSAEGTTSERQVIFKKVPGGFIEGFGQMTMVNNKEVFAKPDQAEFDQHTIFRSTENCLN